MSKTDITNKLTRTLGKASLKLKKHSPEILITVGIVGTVVSAVMACKATTKLNDVLEESKDAIDTIHDGVENGEINGHKYTEEDGKKALTLAYAKTGVNLVKLYGPSVALGAVSIGCILTSNNIIRKRNAALAAAYMTVDKGFKEYRVRVIERFGEELDRELKYNIKAQEIEERVVDENGNEKTVKHTVDVADPNVYSPFAIIFDDGNTGWSKDPEMTKYFLIQQQNYANDKLKAQGYLFLNDVYEMLGAKKTKIGQTFGWIYDEENPIGDNFIDFGIFDIHRPKARDFVNGYERVIVLDFNVDGDILEYM